MARYQILSWHDIPTGVKGEDAHGQVRESLPVRFQAAVDAAATAAGHIETKMYLAGWQWSEPQERAGSAREVTQAVAADLEAGYPPERVKEIRRALIARLNQNKHTNES